MTEQEYKSLGVGDKIEVLQFSLVESCYSRLDGDPYPFWARGEIVNIDKSSGLIAFVLSPTQGKTASCSHFYNSARSNGVEILRLVNKINSSDTNIMPSGMIDQALNYFRNAGKKKEEKNLMKLGLEDPIGTPTEAGLRLAAEMAYAKIRPEILALSAEMLEEEEKKDK
jgi:hypothetical protein